jgi:hypothetical protein
MDLHENMPAGGDRILGALSRCDETVFTPYSRAAPVCSDTNGAAEAEATRCS